MMIGRKYLLSASLVCLTAAAAYGADVFELIMRAQESDSRVSYRGMKTASVFSADQVVTAVLKVVHLKPDKTRTEYFSPPMLAGVVLVQIGSELWRYAPGENVWEPVRCPFAQAHNGLTKDVLQNFSIRLVGSDEIAGRSTYVIYAEPKRPGEVARRIWIDREHYLVIGTQAERPSGQVLNRSRYTSIQFDPGDISPSIFVVSGKIREVKPAPRARFRTFKPTYVPEGYRLVGAQSLRIGQTPCSHLQYSNGANTISLFQRRADFTSDEPKSDGKLLNVYTWSYAGMRFTLVGSISEAELRKMARSVR